MKIIGFPLALLPKNSVYGFYGVDFGSYKILDFWTLNRLSFHLKWIKFANSQFI